MVTPIDADLLDTLRGAGLIAIIRGDSAQWAVEVGEAMLRAGVRLVEVAFTTPGAAEAIEALCRVAPVGTWVGAGTVLTDDDVTIAQRAGARYVVTPGACEAVHSAVGRDLPVIAGAWTASEVYAASRAGASAVKIFPVSSGGPQHLRALRGPFPDIPLVGVGGVGLDDVAPLLAAGAIAVGVGSPLTGAGDAPAVVEARARAYVEACKR